MTLPPPKVCRRIRQLHAMLGSPHANEAENAREALNKILTAYGLSWNDLPEILAVSDPHPPQHPAASSAGPTPTRPEVNVLDLVLRLVEDHIAVTPEERLAIALWILHTYRTFADPRFIFTPRLALLSPVRGCGKTTVLDLLELLITNAFSSDEPTPASIYYELNRRPDTTLMLLWTTAPCLEQAFDPVRRLYRETLRPKADGQRCAAVHA